MSFFYQYLASIPQIEFIDDKWAKPDIKLNVSLRWSIQKRAENFSSPFDLNKIKFHLWKTVLFNLLSILFALGAFHFGLSTRHSFTIWMQQTHAPNKKKNENEFHQQSLIFMIRIHWIDKDERKRVRSGVTPMRQVKLVLISPLEWF